MIGQELRSHPSSARVAREEQLVGSMVNPEANSLAYHGHPVQELCRHRSFEEVAYLLWHGELPTREQISAQNRAERAQRAIDPYVARVLAEQPSTAHHMDTLRTAVSALGANDPAEHDITPAAIRAQTLRLFAVLPSIIAMDQRRRHGLGAVAPRSDLSYAANFLYMTFGKLPEPQVVAAFEKSLILYAGHGFSASTPTGRVVSPLSDLYSAVAAAIGALQEASQDGGGEAVMEMMNEIAIPDNARPWLEEALADGRSIPGFGHHVCADGDDTVSPMRAALGMIAALRGGQHLIEVYDAFAAVMHEAMGLRPNLDYPAAPAYHLIGFDTAMFTPVLAAARLPGWTARICEQLAANDGLAERHPAGER